MRKTGTKLILVICKTESILKLMRSQTENRGRDCPTHNDLQEEKAFLYFKNVFLDYT